MERGLISSLSCDSKHGASLLVWLLVTEFLVGGSIHLILPACLFDLCFSLFQLIEY